MNNEILFLVILGTYLILYFVFRKKKIFTFTGYRLISLSVGFFVAGFFFSDFLISHNYKTLGMSLIFVLGSILLAFRILNIKY